MQSRRRAALADSLFPNTERQREKSLLLLAHQSHHHRGCWPSPPKITSVLPDTHASWGQRGTIHSRAAVIEKSEAGGGGWGDWGS